MSSNNRIYLEIDLVPFGVTFVFCVFVGLSQGILIGTAVNLGMLLYSTARPRIRIHKIKVCLFYNINKTTDFGKNKKLKLFCL